MSRGSRYRFDLADRYRMADVASGKIREKAFSIDSRF
jgi:hypothetical protein